MLIKLTKKILKSIDDGNLDRFDIDMQHLRYGNDSISIEINDWPMERLEEFKHIVSLSKVFGSKAVIYDLETWMNSISETEGMEPDHFLHTKCRKVEFFAQYLKKYYSQFKQHRIYENSLERGVMFCSYIYDIEYHPKVRTYNGETIPEHVTFSLVWKEFNTINTDRKTFYQADCGFNTTVEQILNRKHLYVPTKALDKQYEKSIQMFEKTAWNIGEQYLATGAGSDDVDSAESSRRYRWGKTFIRLDKDDEPANVVVDVFHEDDEEKSSRNKDSSIDPTWWARAMDNDGPPDEITEEIPIHPNLVIFALKKQLRLRVHINQLQKYVYDRSMSDKLVLPVESTNLVRTLINYKGGFQDIVKNKGGGAIVLCTGVPGTGKTLTAEVYSESMEKPLYSIQCSQLGTDADELEKYLVIAFERAERWNAVLLLDEADVYVRERGNDLQQNAIVGVFLRVLEYYHGVMFMTSNLGDIVDDAIASRCIARITFEKPAASDARKIWRILAEVMGLSISDAVINQLVKRYNSLSGRDIKNLLKLAKLMQDENKPKPLTLATITFVKQFKPTK